jgi:hypothetical protein
VSVTNARQVSAPTAPWVELAAEGAGRRVEVIVTPDTCSTTQRPSATGAVPLQVPSTDAPDRSRAGGAWTAPWMFIVFAGLRWMRRRNSA